MTLKLSLLLSKQMNISDNGKRKTTDKIVKDYELLGRAVDGLRAINHKVVLTIGSWDLLHIGHVRYLLRAKDHGDILVVGVDTDRAVKLYKGPLRPVVPENERCEMLSYQACVDLITLVDDVDEKGKWQYELVKRVKPDVFIAVEDSYPQEQIDELKKHSKEVIVLPRKANATSTSKMIQETVKKNLEAIQSFIDKR